jgi:hypothetical protein
MFALRPVLFAFVSLLAAASAMLVAAALASAHEDREVGELVLEVGFVIEPAYEGMQNGAHIGIARKRAAMEAQGDSAAHVEGDEHAHEDTTPVTGLVDSLKVELTHVPTGVSKVMAVREVLGTPGVYRADFVPTAPGVYRFRFFGTIEGQEFNETFESGPDTFSEVKAQADVQFPQSVGSLREVSAATRGAEASAERALDRASSASTLGIVGIVVGAIGVATGGAGMALAVRRKGRSQRWESSPNHHSCTD